MISANKWSTLLQKMTGLRIEEEHLIEKFILGSGKGGQNLHKTASTVYLKHVPSGLEIKCQESRSRADNRYLARARLCEKLQAILTNEKTKKQQKLEKLRRQKKRRSRRSKQKMMDDKSQQGKLKVLRKNPLSNRYDRE